MVREQFTLAKEQVASLTKHVDALQQQKEEGEQILASMRANKAAKPLQMEQAVPKRTKESQIDERRLIEDFSMKPSFIMQ